MKKDFLKLLKEYRSFARKEMIIAKRNLKRAEDKFEKGKCFSGPDDGQIYNIHITETRFDTINAIIEAYKNYSKTKKHAHN